MKQTINLNGTKVVIDTNRKNVAAALVALVEACAERQFPIGMSLEHDNGDNYILANIQGRAYLVNENTGRTRNDRKVVKVQGTWNKVTGEGYYTTDLPCEHDRFIDPDGDGEFLDI
ncbi:MAG: hypothetical protein IMZ70_08405 [Candidatus Atribacteria bacterium]|nr:hypothetical protein [Candidatus Atribacteria bacterium]